VTLTIFPLAHPASNFKERKQSVHANKESRRAKSEWEWEIKGLRWRGRVRESARGCEREHARESKSKKESEREKKMKKQKRLFSNTTRDFHEEKCPD